MSEYALNAIGSEEEVPEYVNSDGQVGNKVWRLVPGDGISIDKTTTSSVDTYTVHANISGSSGNVLQVKTDGLYVPEITSKVESLREEIKNLRDKIDKLDNMELRSTESVNIYRSTDEETGDEYITADVNLSTDKDNGLEIKPDGLFAKSMDVTPGSINDINARLTRLEEELVIISQEIDNLKTSATLYPDGTVDPPVVIPDTLDEV